MTARRASFTPLYAVWLFNRTATELNRTNRTKNVSKNIADTRNRKIFINLSDYQIYLESCLFSAFKMFEGKKINQPIVLKWFYGHRIEILRLRLPSLTIHRFLNSVRAGQCLTCLRKNVFSKLSTESAGKNIRTFHEAAINASRRVFYVFRLYSIFKN